MQRIARPVDRYDGPEQDIKRLIRREDKPFRIYYGFKGREVDFRPFSLLYISYIDILLPRNSIHFPLTCSSLT